MSKGQDNNLASELERLDDACSLEDCMEQVRAVFDLYQVGHACLQSLSDAAAPSEALWRILPDDVSIICNGLVERHKHPAIITGKNRHFPYDLFEFRSHFSDDPEVEAFIEACRDNGVSALYALPITTENGSYIFVVGRPNARIQLPELLALQSICSNAVNLVSQFTRHVTEENVPSNLTYAQKQVLIGVARGMDNNTIAHSLDLGGDTIAVIQEQIVDSLGAANSRHAIVLSLIAGELTLADCAPIDRA